VAKACEYPEEGSMKNIEKRIQSLEEIARPRIISTLADLVRYAAFGSDEEVELSPQLQELFGEVAEIEDRWL
jgi:hypothetical protein